MTTVAQPKLALHVRAMRMLTMMILLSSLMLGSVACNGDEDEPASKAGSGAGARGARRLVEQVQPPVDLKAPPSDAAKTASGLRYKKLAVNDAGARVSGHDAALVHYTGWRARTGETFFSTKNAGQPIAMDPEHAAPAFAEALQLLHKGERAAVWVPAGEGAPEALVYEIEVVDFVKPVAAATPGQAERSAPDAAARAPSVASGSAAGSAIGVGRGAEVGSAAEVGRAAGVGRATGVGNAAGGAGAPGVASRPGVASPPGVAGAPEVASRPGVARAAGAAGAR